MFAPFVNSYKRYQLGSWAPTAIVWSHDNRTCGFRTVGEHKGYRVECRIPGADANPYLAFAATIAAGCAGIENKVEPPEMFVRQRVRGQGRPARPDVAPRGGRRVPRERRSRGRRSATSCSSTC